MAGRGRPLDLGAGLAAAAAAAAVLGALAPPLLALLVLPAAVLAAAVALRRDRAARDGAVEAFVAALAAKDPYTAEHTRRVARYSVWIGEELGLSRRRLAHLRRCALLHDVGKLLLPATLLAKPDRLTDEEFRRVQRHAHDCEGLLAAVDVLRPFACVAAGHHRRFDGGGYGGRPRVGTAAAIVAVADAYDAMTSSRAYRRALPQATAFVELRAGAGGQFDPRCVAALVQAVERRGERHGLGHERSAVVYPVEPPVRGPGSAGVPGTEVPAPPLPAPVGSP